MHDTSISSVHESIPSENTYQGRTQTSTEGEMIKEREIMEGEGFDLEL